MNVSYCSINIFDELKEKYKNSLRKEVTSVYIIQTKFKVYLEIENIYKLEGGLEKKSIKRTDLYIIRENKSGDLTFNPDDKIEINARKFINELSPNIISSVFNLIDKKYNKKIIELQYI